MSFTETVIINRTISTTSEQEISVVFAERYVTIGLFCFQVEDLRTLVRAHDKEFPKSNKRDGL